MTDIDCDTIDIISYLEGEPDDGTRRHLDSCATCREQLAHYRRLIEAMIQSRPSSMPSISCPQREQTVAAAAGESAVDQEHLARCPVCRDLAADITHVLADIDSQAAASTASLPEGISKLVARRNAAWQAERFKKVLDFQGIKNRKKQDRMTRAFFETDDDSLPKAAFPDDLAKNGDSDEEDRDPSD